MKALQFVLSITQLKFIKSEIDRLLGYSMLFSILLVIVRVWYSHELVFVFMPWNLFLAYVPYKLLQISKSYIVASKSKIGFGFIFFVWLVFIPNAFYMITDLFHLYQRERVPLWFDLILLMSYAWNGLILGMLSVREMEKMLAVMIPRLHRVIFIMAIMFLNSLGVYLGRYLRFNSWDIVADPFNLVLQMIGMFYHKEPWAMIVSFTVMMSIMYQMVCLSSPPAKEG